MTEQIRSIETYLESLRSELEDSDPALMQDALYDAESHLRTELQRRENAGEETQLALQDLLDAYGTPGEVADAYRSTDATVAAALAPPTQPPPSSLATRIFGVLADPRAYSALIFMLLSLPIGILYFTWAIAGLSISIGMSILIIGLPVVLTYLASIRAFSLIEGRIVETLLGVRMPRRPLPPQTKGSIIERVLYWLRDGRTWATILYMVIRLPLGVLYFSLAVIMLTASLTLFAAPAAQLVTDFPILNFGSTRIYLPFWTAPIFWLAAALDLLLLLHLAKAVGRLQAALAKSMLVGSSR